MSKSNLSVSNNALATNHHEMTDDQMRLIKATVAKNATNDELSLFLYRCKHMDLDPLKPGHIHFVKYGNNPGTIIIGIDGFRSKAAKTGKHTGTKRGLILDNAGQCRGAWAEVYRSDWTQPAREEVSLSEYNTGKSNWAKMPETMIKKVAEVAALRMAFPDDLGGIYSDDEMAQAESEKDVSPKAEVRDVLAEHKKEREAVAVDPGEYRITFGKFKTKKLSECDPYDLASYIAYIENKAKEDGKELRGQVLEFITAATSYVETKIESPAALEAELEDAFT
jgi:phage recombination protein Bet